MNRREFTIEAALALLGCTMVTLTGCDTGIEPSPVYVDLTGQISSNHGHAATITAAQFRDGGALDLDIRGAAGHTHVVSLSPSELATLRDGGRVQKKSSGAKHTHFVTFQG